MFLISVLLWVITVICACCLSLNLHLSSTPTFLSQWTETVSQRLSGGEYHRGSSAGLVSGTSKTGMFNFENAYLTCSGSACMHVCVCMCGFVSNLILLISGEAFKRVLPALKQQDQCPTAKSRGASVPYWWGQLGESSHTPNPHLFNTYLNCRKHYSCDPLYKIISAECVCFFSVIKLAVKVLKRSNMYILAQG